MTATKLVQEEIGRFLSTTDSEVLCISGEWGVGKTFTWQTMLDQAAKEKTLKIGRYSYVSLFGISSLEGLKLSIFENSEFLLPEEPNGVLDRAKRGGSKLLQLGQKSKDVAAELPIIGGMVKVAGPLFFSTVRNQIICIDDLERRSADLRITDVLGLVSFLKEQRKCKVVLLLNDEEFGKDGKEEFQNYFEKVVDGALRFTPEPEDSVRIALPGTDTVSQKIGENCTALRISNIRVIKKIERFVRNIEPLISKFDGKVFHQAAHSLTLLGWSKYQPKNAPPLDFLTTRKAGSYLGLMDEGDVPAEEVAWNALLQAYGFTITDEFDLALIEGIENGFFNREKIQKEAAALDRSLKLEKKEGSFKDAWRTYHDSFDDNQEEVLDTIYASFKETVHGISPMNLNGTVKLFKELGRQEQAIELIQFYIEERKEDREFWNLGEYAFSEEITDPDIMEVFKEKFEWFEVVIDPHAILMEFAQQNSWHDQDLAALATLSSDQYYELFKTHKGRELSKMISGALQFDRIVNASSQMQKITERVKEALTKIGEESKINARRVRKFGIKVDEEVAASTIVAPAEPDEE